MFDEWSVPNCRAVFFISLALYIWICTRAVLFTDEREHVRVPVLRDRAVLDANRRAPRSRPRRTVSALLSPSGHDCSALSLPALIHYISSISYIGTPVHHQLNNSPCLSLTLLVFILYYMSSAATLDHSLLATIYKFVAFFITVSKLENPRFNNLCAINSISINRKHFAIGNEKM